MLVHDTLILIIIGILFGLLYQHYMIHTSHCDIVDHDDIERVKDLQGVGS